MPEREDEHAIIATFLRRYADDRAAGNVRELAEYQQRYPGYEAAVAAEFEALQGGGARHALNEVSEVRDGDSLSADTAARYTSLAEIARGGMGIVLRAWDRDLQRTVAMKVLPRREPGTDMARDSHAIARFLREARITGQLEHPGVVPVHALGRDAHGRLFFTMAMVEGEEFGAVIRQVRAAREGPWTLPRAVEVLLRVCDAMAFAHGKGIVHRDLKPGNIMVGRFGETYVMDWGLARDAAAGDGHATDDALDALLDGRRTRAGEVFGTPAYMPPEQARGDVAAIDHRSDVYAIGAMLYELLTGDAPYCARGGDNSSAAVLQRVVAGPAPRIAATEAVPAELGAICHKAMAREPAHRYQTVLELAADLRAFLEQRVVRAYEVGAFAELRKWVRRNRALAFAGVLLVVGPVAFALRERAAGKQLAHARDAAEAQLATKDEILRFLDEDLLAAVAPEEQGRDVSMRQVLDVAAAHVDGRFDGRPEVEAELRRTIGSTYRKLGVLGDAAKHLQRAVDLWLRTVGQDDRRTLAAQRQLAVTWRQLDRLEDAEGLNRRVLAVSERVLGVTDDDTLTAANNLGYALLSRGHYAEAEGLLRRVYEARLARLGATHENTILSMRNLGQLYRLWGRYPQAAPLLERAWQLARDNLPPEHPEQLLATQEWGLCLEDLGRAPEAIQQATALCALSDRIRGPRHVETIRCRMNLAIVHRNHGEFAESLRAADEAIARSGSLPEHHHLRYEQASIRADALSGLGRTADALQDLDAAAAKLESHPSPTAALRYDLVRARIDVLRRAKAWPATLTQCEAALAVCAEGDLGGPRRGAIQIYRSRALRHLDRTDEAEAALLAAEPDFAGTVNMAALCRDLIDLYRATDRPTEVAHWQKRLAELVSR